MPARLAKPKTVSYSPIPQMDGDGQPTRWYREMAALIASHHPDLVEIKIGLQWYKGWKPDADGKLCLGTASLSSAREQQWHGFNCFVNLNEDWYHDPQTRDLDKIAVLDHELCHFAVVKDDNGDTKKDEKGQPVVRIVKHDLEEFEKIVNRYGLYTDNLRRMAGAIYEAREREARQRRQPQTDQEE